MAPPDGTHEQLSTAHDFRWARDVRDSLRCAGALLGFLLLLD
ncbi:hypothetical protein [Streptomyces stelliscabiei]